MAMHFFEVSFNGGRYQVMPGASHRDAATAALQTKYEPDAERLAVVPVAPSKTLFEARDMTTDRLLGFANVTKPRDQRAAERVYRTGKRFCLRCGLKSEPTDTFCAECGTRIKL